MLITGKQHRSFDPAGFHLPVHIVGCGGMGSHVATALARMGVGRENSPIYLYDHDTYEPHNLATQSVDTRSVGMPKVVDLKAKLRSINPDILVFPTESKVDATFRFTGFVFLCLDNMEERKEIVEFCIEGDRDVKCVIETRMDSETGISHCFKPSNQHHMECWWLYWYPSGHTERAPSCGDSHTSIMAIYGTTSLAINQFQLHARKKTRHTLPNRVYQDFRYPRVDVEYW